MPQTSLSPEIADDYPGSAAHVIGKSPEALLQGLKTAVNLGLWKRPPQTEISRELAALGAKDLPDMRCATTLETFDHDVCPLLQKQTLDPLAFSHWRNDMRRLATHFFTVAEGREVTIRLLTTSTDDCRRFHFDRCNLRLLCTYLGPGTEWLTDEQVDRQAQGSGAPNEDIIRFGEPSAFEPFWVGILKGEAYPGNAGHALIHRSPSIESTRQTRVLFCLDC